MHDGLNESAALRAALARERAAREQAEALLEDRSRALYLANQRLEEAGRRLQQRADAADLVAMESLERLGLALRAGGIGLWEWDPASDRVTLDAPLRELLGVEAGAAETLESWLGRVHPEDREATRSALRSADRCGLEPLDFRARDAAGRWRTLRTKGAVESPAPRRLCVLLRDVTEEAAAEAAARSAAAARSRLERLALLGELATSIAHEVNQPLASIANYAGAGSRLLASGAPPEEVRGALEQIAALAHRAGQIIRNVRALIVRPRPATERADLLEVARRAVAAAGGGSAVRLEGEPVVAPCHALLIEHALLNLVRNALEAQSGGAAPARVTVRVGAAGAEATLTVDDEGPGLGSMGAEEAFEPLRTTKGEGTGMGLALCRSIAEQHGGTVAFERNPAHATGLRASMRIPLR